MAEPVFALQLVNNLLYRPNFKSKINAQFAAVNLFI